MYEKNMHIYEFETTSPNWLFHHSGKTSNNIPQRLWWINSVSMLTLVHRKFATARSRRNFCFGFISWKKRMMFLRECFHMMDAVWRLKYLVETYHHIIFSQRWSFSSPIKRYLRRERNYHDLLIIFFGDIVEFLDGNVLRWKMLEMQMPWPDIDVCVIFKKRRCSGWKRGETHWILNIPKAYNSLPLQKWRLCRVLSFWEG